MGILSRELAALGVCALLTVVAAPLGAAQTDRSVFVTGAASSSDARAAGTVAAQEALNKLDGVTPRLAVVFSVVDEGAIDATRKVMNGVATVFDTSIIVGATGKQCFTDSGIDHDVVVWVVGGPGGIHKATAHYEGASPNDATLRACGRTLGNALADVAIPQGHATLCLLFGGCDYPRNGRVVEGLVESLGSDVPLAGMSSSSTVAEVCVGTTILPVNTNLCVLLYGGFTPHFGFVATGSWKSSWESAQAKVADSYNAAATAVAPQSPDAVVVFDCEGRKGGWVDNGFSQCIGQSVDTIVAAAGEGVPVCGIFTYGEIGKANDQATASGKGGSVSVVSLTARSVPTGLIARAPALPRDGGISWRRRGGVLSVSSTNGAAGMVRLVRINGAVLLSRSLVPNSDVTLPANRLARGGYVLHVATDGRASGEMVAPLRR